MSRHTPPLFQSCGLHRTVSIVVPHTPPLLRRSAAVPRESQTKLQHPVQPSGIWDPDILHNLVRLFPILHRASTIVFCLPLVHFRRGKAKLPACLPARWSSSVVVVLSRIPRLHDRSALQPARVWSPTHSLPKSHRFARAANQLLYSNYFTTVGFVMASASFRDSIGSLGWSRRQDEPVSTAPETGVMASIRNLNPFQDRSYVRLPTSETGPGAPLPAPTRREEEEGWFILSRWDRLLIFGACNLAALACFVICFTLFPVLSIRPRKFVILWTVGSVLFLASFAAVMGPMNYVYHLLSAPRLPFTAAYIGSIVLTLVFAIKLHSTILTLMSSLVQLACLVWYLISYFPMGSTGLRLAASFGARQATSWM
ncbi:hypothetical protein E4U46_000995 [Claviceps purpurea]|nr:hypothetical protein E4U46_000995 [Claviceps purpurea]